ncbi:MAG: hypothetical protein WA919_27760 [Coleofasciculaceae cyanobacterium]
MSFQLTRFSFIAVTAFLSIYGQVQDLPVPLAGSVLKVSETLRQPKNPSTNEARLSLEGIGNRE